MAKAERYRYLSLGAYQRSHGLRVSDEASASAYRDSNSFLYEYFPEFHIEPQGAECAEVDQAYLDIHRHQVVDAQDSFVDVFVTPPLPECYKAVEASVHAPKLEPIDAPVVESCALRHSVLRGKVRYFRRFYE